MASRKRGADFSRIQEGLNYYTGQYAIEEERQRQRAQERLPLLTELQWIEWDPETTYTHAPDKSSRVEAFRYVITGGAAGAIGYTGTLFVRFHKYGTEWKYLNVPEPIFQAFANAQSKGRYINAILNGFPNSRATADEVSTFFTQQAQM